MAFLSYIGRRRAEFSVLVLGLALCLFRGCLGVEVPAAASSISHGASVYTSSVTLTSNQILNLFTTPVQIIPAPPAGKIIQPLSCYGKLNYGTATYVLNGGQVMATIGTSAFASLCGTTLGSVIIAPSSQAALITPSSTAVSVNAAPATAVNLIKTTANFTAGDGTAYIAITYRIIDAQ